jgi:hypothetical protein
MPLPVGPSRLFYDLRARRHGLVVLELFGHLVPLGKHGEEPFGNAMSRAAAARRAARLRLEPGTAGH